MSLVKFLICAYIVKVINFMICLVMVHTSKDYFLYFAYGSNLFKKRIRINNPSAEFVGIGLLDNHQIDFVRYFENWGGAVATVVPRNKTKVWGAIWKMHSDAIATLDKQEGVLSNEYFPRFVSIQTADGSKAKCRTYQHTHIPKPREVYEKLPKDRRPSITYKECIVQGAIECNLPIDYINMLKELPHNGQFACDDIRKRLNI